MRRRGETTTTTTDPIAEAMADLLTLAVRGGAVADALRLQLAQGDYEAGNRGDAADGVADVARHSRAAIMRERAAEVALAMAGQGRTA